MPNDNIVFQRKRPALLLASIKSGSELRTKSAAHIPYKKPSFREGLIKSGSELSSHNLADALLSPLKRLTTEFGMGSGRTATHKPPEMYYITIGKCYQEERQKLNNRRSY